MMTDYPTNIASAALQRASEGQPSHGGQPSLGHWVAQRWAARWASGGPLENSLLGAYSFIPKASSVPSDFLLHWFWPPTANLCPHCICSRGTELASMLTPIAERPTLQPAKLFVGTGWLVESGLLCAEPLHCYQRPSGGSRDGNRRPPCPPPRLLPPLGGRLCF